jgi:hypothetical protein
MMTEEDVIIELKAGKTIEWAGNKVTAEGIKYSWQTPVIWINFENGSGYKAGYREIRAMKVVDNKAA